MKAGWKWLLATVALAGSLVAQAAQPWINMPNPMPVQAPKGKVEVIEFFWLGCPHCYHLEPKLNAWLKTLPADVQFRRVHAAWNAGMQKHAQLYATIETLKMPQLIGPAFDAIHKQELELRDADVVKDWAGKQKVNGKPLNAATFMGVYNSFGVQTYANRAPKVTQDYGISGVPTFVVQGKFMTSVSDAGGEDQLFAVLNQLIAQSRKAP
ncbi:thiol:disulfide interchange protein DsbA/DsbL [Leeia aquatica]|uniref:Thiol:disulfide interchange protein n=1 Tax=Leeia aquatica TaxID=2725557 RepID=A0A847SB76_9NEIS|nr:thiol:disulfide interchange protein DsbA/DsbL [Leeia aquatica]NLR76157.1 thiol:disulfide interchange protein DsbA/DsbL [Leeia aquatica]